MKRLLSLWLAGSLALSSFGPAAAAEIRQGELPAPRSPVAPVQLAALPAAQTLSLPQLPELPAPLAAAAAEAAPPVAAAQPATVQLQAAAQETAPEKPSLASAAEPAGRGFFDGAKLRQKAFDLAEMGQVAVAAHFVSIFPNALTHGTAAHPLAMGALWWGASEAMASMLAQSRRTVVGGWQASHDQRYRVDPNTGNLRDVRGHKYGSDRYEEYAPGRVGPTERILAATLSAAMGLLWVGADLKNALLYAATFGLAAAVAAIVRARRAPAPPRIQSDEDRAHAGRFNVSLASSSVLQAA